MRDVHFVFVNCNRIEYLRSAVDTLELTLLSSKLDVVFTVVDNASVEPGTDEYLSTLRERGHTVLRRSKRSPSDEFASALEEGTSQHDARYTATVTGDVQFVMVGRERCWLDDAVMFMDAYSENIGSLVLDAQRKMTHASHRLVRSGDYFIDVDRYPIPPWGSLVSREMMSFVRPWARDIDAAGLSSLEEHVVRRTLDKLSHSGKNVTAVVPLVPPAIALYSPSGPAAKVRLNERYGEYLASQGGDGKYYFMVDYDVALSYARASGRTQPLSIEEVAHPIGWKMPLNPDGSLNKGSLDHGNRHLFPSTPLETPATRIP